jgi:hypothetical protein
MKYKGTEHPDVREKSSMSKELQEKADRIMRELQDALVPLKEEINSLKRSSGRFK